MVTMYDEFEFAVDEVVPERTREVMSIFEGIERESVDWMSRCGSSEELAEWVGVEGVREERVWGLDWLWGLNEDAWHETFIDEEEDVEQDQDWEAWSDQGHDDDDEDQVYRERVSDDEAEHLFMKELDGARWANPMRTTHTRVELLEALEHMDRWDVRVDVSMDDSFEVEEVVVTSLSGAWDSYEVRWRADEEFEPLA